MNSNDFYYVHIGTDYITKDLWVDIIQEEAVKPIGGLWTCPFNNIQGSISDWTDLLLETERLIHFPQENGCLIKINPNSNICWLDSISQLDKIKQIHHIHNQINYEELAQLYDAVFISPYALPEEFRVWAVRTLLIFNLDIIDSYIPILIQEINRGFYITEEKPPCKIDSFSIDYSKIAEEINSLFDQYLNLYAHLELKEAIHQAEDEIYSYIIKKFPNKINSKVDNYYIFKSILLNEKHRQYKKRK